MESKTYNMDCMEYMRGVPDKFFDLAVVDPPYGIGAATFGMGGTAARRSVAREIYKARVSSSRHSGSGTLKNRVLNRTAEKFENWDIAPTQDYFEERFRKECLGIEKIGSHEITQMSIFDGQDLDDTPMGYAGAGDRV